MRAATDVVDTMLAHARRDIRECLPNVGAGLAIIPKDEYVTTLPEFADLKGKRDFTGRAYESFRIRGLGGVKGTARDRNLGKRTCCGCRETLMPLLT